MKLVIVGLLVFLAVCGGFAFMLYRSDQQEAELKKLHACQARLEEFFSALEEDGAKLSYTRPSDEPAAATLVRQEFVVEYPHALPKKFPLNQLRCK